MVAKGLKTSIARCLEPDSRTKINCGRITSELSGQSPKFPSKSVIDGRHSADIILHSVRLSLSSSVPRHPTRRAMQTLPPISDTVVCHCLNVTKSEIESAIVTSDEPSLRAVMNLTCAGTGCTACHRAIRRLMADQCPFASSSPTCVMR